MQTFRCQRCAHCGPANDGIEQDDDGRNFVACEHCAARHEVADDPARPRSGRQFKVVRIFAEDQA